MRLVLLGTDKLSRDCAWQIRSDDVRIAVDRSSDINRVLKVVRSGALSPMALVKIASAEFSRICNTQEVAGPTVASSAELVALIRYLQPSQVILFRAGLIVRKDVLQLGIPIWNIHAAHIPDYGGLGAIYRALRDGAYHQAATLHIVTEKIDSGEVLDTEPYKLDRSISYSANEGRAYDAGIALLRRTLGLDKASAPMDRHFINARRLQAVQ